MSAMNKSAAARQFEARLRAKFESFFHDPDIAIAITALRLTLAEEIMVVRDLLMLAHAAGAEALSEMQREDENEEAKH